MHRDIIVLKRDIAGYRLKKGDQLYKFTTLGHMAEVLAYKDSGKRQAIMLVEGLDYFVVRR